MTIEATRRNLGLLTFLILVFCQTLLIDAREDSSSDKLAIIKKGSTLPKVLTSGKPEGKKSQKKDSDRIGMAKRPKRGPGEVVEKKESLFSFTLSARKFAQGEVLFLSISPEAHLFSKLDRVKVTWEGNELSVSKKEGTISVFIPISPEFSKSSGILEITEKNLFRKNESKKYEIPIRKTAFATTKVSHLTMDKQYTSDKLPEETMTFIRECSEAKSKAFHSKTDLQIASDFEYPVSKPILNSPFYKRRIYNKEKGKPHGGVDFKGGVGEPIYAINDGSVILARPMHYEGNFTVIDHGSEIYSLYMHQSELLVKVGDKIKKGDLIGKVGTTGMSTGPHLHLGLRIHGTMVDPLSVIQTKLFQVKKETRK
ncbi:M23 family metallopeptidase [Leptospira fainei]|uniref:M23 family metallopeptidase n=1 Tax=Leptospira fainei TaxID=48782 RepID=UPI00267C0EF3